MVIRCAMSNAIIRNAAVGVMVLFLLLAASRNIDLAEAVIITVLIGGPVMLIAWLVSRSKQADR